MRSIIHSVSKSQLFSLMSAAVYFSVIVFDWFNLYHVVYIFFVIKKQNITQNQ